MPVVFSLSDSNGVMIVVLVVIIGRNGNSHNNGAFLCSYRCPCLDTCAQGIDTGTHKLVITGFSSHWHNVPDRGSSASTACHVWRNRSVPSFGSFAKTDLCRFQRAITVRERIYLFVSEILLNSDSLSELIQVMLSSLYMVIVHNAFDQRRNVHLLPAANNPGSLKVSTVHHS